MTLSLSILALILGYTWVLAPLLPRWAAGVVAAVVLGLSAWRASRTGEWGLRSSALWPASWRAVAVTLPALAAMAAAGWALGSLHHRDDTWRDYAYLVAWAAGQQFALQTVLLREAQAATSRRPGIALAAAGFAALHLPNPFLTAVTLVGGLLWCAIYARHPNLLPLALSHALATVAILHCFDPEVTGRLRVGYAYLQLD